MGKVNYLSDEFDRVFGSDSTGETPSERALTSAREFVRSQSQLACARDGATGYRIKAKSALKLVGYPALQEVAERGSVVLNSRLSEPADTLRSQRVNLDLTVEQVAKATGLTKLEISSAEQAGTITPIRKLQRLAQALGLNDELLSVRSSAGADNELAVRLRTLKQAGEDGRLSAGLVLKLAEAAWTVSRQRELCVELEIRDPIYGLFESSDDYNSPVWRQGYLLAEKSRRLLGIDPVAPIPSVRALIERTGVPLVQEDMGKIFAGATVENGTHRGLVVNVEGHNSQVWVRRITLAHELGHLLWDPATRLRRLHVDRYGDLRRFDGPPVESRANAFAIAFLAPREAVVEIVKSGADAATQLSELMSRYGIPATAAKYHLANVAREWGQSITTLDVRNDFLPGPDEKWEADENWTTDFFPVATVPIGRRGRFAGIVATAAIRQLITMDSAASYLRTTTNHLSHHLKEIVELTAPDLMYA